MVQIVMETINTVKPLLTSIFFFLASKMTSYPWGSLQYGDLPKSDTWLRLLSLRIREVQL